MLMVFIVELIELSRNFKMRVNAAEFEVKRDFDKLQ